MNKTIEERKLKLRLTNEQFKKISDFVCCEKEKFNTNEYALCAQPIMKNGNLYILFLLPEKGEKLKKVMIRLCQR